MCQQNQKIVQINIDDFKAIFGEKVFETAAYMAGTLKTYLDKGDRFTGKIVFTINCSNGGIGSAEAYIQKKI